MAQKRRAFARCTPPNGLLDFVEAHVVAEAHQLTTRVAHFDAYHSRGFTGWRRFRAMAGTPEQWRALNALAHFAFYPGTSHKTTMELGQTRWLL